MNKFYFTLALFSILIIGCDNSASISDTKAQDIFARGTEEDPLAALNYQFERTKSPVTNSVPNNIHVKELAFASTLPNLKDASSNNWQFRGPSNVGGRTRALQLDAGNENRILAGGVSGGLWISEDAGDSFTKSTTSQMLHSITCLAQDTRVNDRNVWYYGTGELSGNSSDLVGHGIYKSTDNGLSWTVLPATSPDNAQEISLIGDFNYVTDIVVHPTTGQIVASTFAGIFSSEDGGTTWNNRLIGDGDPNGFGYLNFGNQTNVYCTSSGVYYASLSSDCNNRGIWRSTDGINWNSILPAGFDNTYRRIEMAAAPSNENILYFVIDASTDPFTDEHAFWKYTYLSGDGSGMNGTWVDRTANLPAGQCTGFYDFDFGYYQTQSSYDMVVAVHPTNENMVFIGGTNIYRSTDAFATNSGEWIGGYQCDPVNPSNYVWPNHHPDQHGMKFLPSNPNVMISSHDGGISRTDNCLQDTCIWESLNNDYGTTQFYTIAMEHGAVESEQIIGGLQDNGTWLTNTIDPNQAWFDIFYGDGAYCAIAEGRENYYVSWQGGKTFKFQIADDGNVTGLTRIDPIGGDDYRFINPFILDPSNNNTMYLLAGSVIYRNDSLTDIPITGNEYNAIDFGWEKILQSNIEPAFPVGGIPRITAIGMSPNNSDVLYYGANSGAVYKLTGLDTKTYARTLISQGLPNGYVSSIGLNPEDANEVVVTYSNYEVRSVFHSIDSGDNWIDISGNMEEFADGSGDGPSVNWGHIYKDADETRYYIGTSVGLFSTDLLEGDSTIWFMEGNTSIGNVPVFMIDSRPFDKNIVVATHGNGIFSTKEYISAIDDVLSEVNKVFLGIPYPNPIKEYTKIELRAQNATKVDVNVFNLKGQKVAHVYSSENHKGNVTLKWYKGDLAPGAYFISADYDGKSIAHSVIIE